jgi:hypothetical protein
MRALPLGHQPPPSADPAIDEQLDDAMSKLGDAERTAVTLQYLQGLSTSAVATRMGISETAARKRSSRAVEKLRAFFETRGLAVASAALAETMLRHSQITAPPQLVSAAASMSVTPAAAALAQAATAAMLVKTVVTTTAAVASVVVGVTVIAGAAVLFGNFSLSPAPGLTTPSQKPIASTTAPPPRARPSPPTAPPATRSANAIKVGVYLSNLTAQSQGPDNRRLGYNSQVRILRELKDYVDIDLRAIIEPGTDATDGELRRKLDVHFPGQRPIAINDAAALRQLQVIVLNSKSHVPDDAVNAIDSAVRGGVGLFVRQGFGDGAPGHTSQIARLVGLREVSCARSDPTQIEVDVCGAHPILGTLSGQTGQRVTVRANGLYGPLAGNTVPLLRVRSMGSMAPCHDKPARSDAGWMFHPLYVSEYGGGRVIVCSFAAYTETPAGLMAATENQFVPRCMRWLARRRMDGQE